jgi:multiple sugar transport system ATP-binding protein
MADIVLQNVKKNFGDFIAVENSNLKVEDGDFFVMLGPSGCGKTTTLRMIAGLEMPTSGNILLDKENVTSLRASQRDIAFVFQMFALYPHLNVEKNISFPLRMQKMKSSEIKKRVAEVSQLLKIKHLLKHNISNLAGGDRQRVALGRAIVRRPAAFLMDEPLGTLDAEFREEMCLELKKLHNRIHATTVYVTHDQIEAMTMGDKIAVMNQGIILQNGTPNEIYSKPKTKFVGSFIGSPSMNFIPVDVAIKKGASSVVIDSNVFNIPVQHAETIADKNYIGVRPEKMTLTQKKGIAGEVYASEYLGNRNILTINTEVGQFKVRVSKDSNVCLHENVKITFDPHSAIIFDGASDKALPSAYMTI